MISQGVGGSEMVNVFNEVEKVLKYLKGLNRKRFLFLFFNF